MRIGGGLFDAGGIWPGRRTADSALSTPTRKDRVMGALVHPIAVAGEISGLGAPPCAAGFLGHEDAAAAAVTAALFDYRDQRVGVCVVKTGNSKKANMPDLFVAVTVPALLSVCFETSFCVGNFACRK